MTTRTAPGGRGRTCVHGRSAAAARALIARFDKRERKAIARLAAAHPYVRDLLWSFPGLLYALATHHDAATRESAYALVKAGAPLASIARRLGVAVWMRKLPPEAFCGAVPKLPDDAAFTLQIANYLPAKAEEAAAWLKAVAAGYSAFDAPFALWVAREASKLDLRFGSHGVFAMALFAWFSSHPQTAAGRLIAQPFCDQLSAPAVRDAAAAWLEEIEMHLYAPMREARYAHRSAVAEVGGITFARLSTPQALRLQGQGMNNCVAGYARDMAKGSLLIYALSENGKPVATMDVRLAPVGRPYICGLLGPGNAEVEHHVWQAVMLWLAGWREREGLEVASGEIAAPAMQLWLRLWKPYWLAKGLQEALPMRAFADALDRHQHGLVCCLR